MERRRARFGEFEISYAVAGEGAPILLVPGVMMSVERWVDEGYVAALAEAGRRVLVIDPLGHGQSSKTADVAAYAPRRLVEHLIAVLDDAGVEQADVWGYSRGAIMGDQLALRHPDRVRRFVAGGIPLFDMSELLEQLGMVPEPEVIEARHQRALGGDWAAYWETFPLPLGDEVKRFLEERNDLGSISACRVAAYGPGLEWGVPDGVPTLGYWGTDEVFHDLNVGAVADLPIETATVPGGHGEAFMGESAALDIVLPFLG